MSLAFAAPLALAAVAVIAIPVAIHIVRRAEQRETPFAALRFLRAVGMPRRRLRIAERALLALRAALLAVLALWLAEPHLARAPAIARVVAVAPGVAPEAARAAARIDATTDARWLAPGFPALDTVPPVASQPLASLLRELDATLPPGASLDVVVPDVVEGLDGARPVLTRAVAWHVASGMSTRGEVALPPPATLALRTDDAIARRYVEAVVAAWNTGDAPRVTLVELGPQLAPADETSWLLVLGASLPEAARTWVEAGGTALVAPDPSSDGEIVATDDAGGALLRERRAGRGRVLALARDFTPRALPALADPSFAETLRAWLEPDGAPVDVAGAEALEPVVGSIPPEPARTPLGPWLVLAAAVLAALERVWASGLAKRRLA